MKMNHTLSTVGFGLALIQVALTTCFGQPQGEVTHGTPGVATQRAVLNFPELARQAASPVAAPPEASFAAPVRFTSASLGETPPSPAPASSFQALDDDGSAEVPDTHGAVGPNHLMVTHNFRVRIQDRSGAIVSTVSLTNFWSPVGPFPPRPFNNRIYPGIADPKIFYQPFDQRWIHVAIVAGSQLTNSALLIGVSQTDDPTGNWNLYRIDTSAGGQLFFDYPNVGYNKDWIVAQGHIVRLSDGALLRSDVYAFNKTNLYAGGTGLFTRFERPDQGGEFSRLTQPALTFDNEIGTIYLLGQVDNNLGRNLNQLRLSTITGPVGAEVFTAGPVITTTNRWDNLSAAGFADFAPQLGSTRKIDIIDAVIMGLVYRNGSIWAVQNVFLPAGGEPTRTAIQWWQITPTGEILQLGRLDDPSGQLFYGYPTLAVNRFNDLLIGYSRFGSNQYASANYSFRAGNDPPNTLRSDTVLKAGEAPYYQSVVGHNRWGDFSATVVDPINDTDLWTIQEYAATSVADQSRWGTWWGRISPIHVSAMEIVNGHARIRFTTAPDQTYRVERTQNLASPIAWEPVSGATNVSGTGTLVEVLDARALSQPQRVYRIRLN